jgi:hypothetical protein
LNRAGGAIKIKAAMMAGFQLSSRAATTVFVTQCGRVAAEEVYLQALAHALERAKAHRAGAGTLTPQTVGTVKARFSSGPLQALVTVLHSNLSATKHDSGTNPPGRARIVMGRGRRFLPVEP